MNFEQAEEYLLSLELFGMRFGLDRMHRLMTVLGLPQRRFASIHVVGSNGKSSTVRFCAAILEREGLRTGSYTSPHLRSFRERIEVGERAGVGGGLRGGGHARRAGGGAREPHGGARRPRDAVRGAHRGRVPRAGAARGGGRRDRGRPRRPLRRDERDPLEGAGADLDQPRAHALAGPDARGHRAREARGGARPRDAGGGGAAARGPRDRRGGHRRAPRAARAHASRGASPPSCRFARPAASSTGISRSRRPPPRRSSAGRSRSVH